MKKEINIGMQTTGTSGDVFPYIALARALAKENYKVALVVASTDNKEYGKYSDEHIQIHQIGTKHFDNEKTGYFEIWKKSPIEQYKISFQNQFYPIVKEMNAASEWLCSNCDVVIGNPMQYTLICASEKTNTPYLSLNFGYSNFFTRCAPPTGLPDMGRWFNVLWWKLVDTVANKIFKRDVNQLRQEQSLGPIKSVLRDFWNSKISNMIMVSSVFCKEQPDWKGLNHVCGFYSLPDTRVDWEMPETLQQFIDAGPPPVYFTIGGCVNFLENSLEDVVKIFLEATRIAGCRAIIQSDWLMLSAIPDTPSVYKTGNIPHEKVFPYCAAVVHHGSHGTSHTATHCGCPSVVIPYAFDQGFWGMELYRLGVAPAPVPRKILNSEVLAASIKSVLKSSSMKMKATSLSRIMNAENGIPRAADIIDRCIKQLNYSQHTEYNYV